jgi:hypothetical protein
MTKIKYEVSFYRPGEDIPYVSCYVWEFKPQGAEEWARGYFKPLEGIRIMANEAVTS